MKSRVAEFVEKKEFLKDKNAGDVEELVLDSLKIRKLTKEDKKFLENFSELEVLSMNQCSLSTIENIPNLKNLNVLELHDNLLSSMMDFKLIAEAFPMLTTLYMAGNKVDSVSVLEPLKKLENLQELDLGLNPLFNGQEDSHDTLKKIFDLLPELQILNGFDRAFNEVEEVSSEQNANESESSNSEGSYSENNKDTSYLEKLVYGELDDKDDNDEDVYNPETDSSYSEVLSNEEVIDNKDSESEEDEIEGEELEVSNSKRRRQSE